MNSVFDQVCYACIPAESLPVLVELRCEPGVRVALDGERAWVRWEPGNEAVLLRLLAVPGAAFYRFRDGLWYRHGQYLPSFGVPDDMPTQRLDQVLTPAPVRPEPFTLALVQPKPARLVFDQRPRQTSAVLCRLTELAGWANRATRRTLASIRAARWPEKGVRHLLPERPGGCFAQKVPDPFFRPGTRILLLGERLPLLERSERFWGQRVLVPLGYSLEPALPESALAEALELKAEEIVLVRPQEVQIVSGGALQPLTRSGIRLALGEEV